MSGAIDYVHMWEQLDARRAEVQRELTGLEVALNAIAPLAGRQPTGARETHVVQRDSGEDRSTDVPQGPQDVVEDVRDVPPVDLQAGVYSKMNGLEAARHVLESDLKVWSTPDVARAMLAGGFPTNSPNFVTNTYTTLKRLVDRGEAVRVGQGQWRSTKASESAGLPRFYGIVPTQDEIDLD